ncbi:MAG: IgGFc-binding protein [Deltaproteobacteria bacterium]|nr:IgGFc-binding protein [Deltaproteobacteria bacterium]
MTAAHRLDWIVLAFALCACSSPVAASAGSDASPVDAAGSADDGGGDTGNDVTFANADTAFACTGSERACFNDTVAKVCVDGGWQLAEKCADGSLCKDGACAVPASCTPGDIKGCSGPATETICTSDGAAWVDHKCPGKQQCVQGKCRDVVCTPKSPACTGAATYHLCKDDGSGWGDTVDCKSGAMCVGGTCLSLCETNLKFSNNVGCEYWSVDLNNDPSKNPGAPNQPTPEFFPHSVVVANPGKFDATLTFTVHASCGAGGPCQTGPLTCNAKPDSVCAVPATPYALSIADAVVKAGQSKEFKMPVMNVAGSGITPKGIHVQSDQPVVAFQFNPFNSENATSNDGSLLLPQNTLGNEYYGVSLGSRPAMLGFPANNGYLTVVATVPGATQVTVTPSCPVTANPALGVPQDGTKPAVLQTGATYTFTLQQFDVLNLESAPGGPGGGKTDLTGTHILADHPIAVFAGHQATGIADDFKKGDENWDTCCTEHLEEQLMPLQAWSTQAWCVKSKPRGYDVDHWVVVAGQDGVALTTQPAIAGIDGVILKKAGDSVHIQSGESFMLQASGKVEVVQFLVSQGQTQQKTGDPSMLVVPPAKQYRDEYLVQTADGYSNNWLTVVRPKGAGVQLDGLPMQNGAFADFGDGSWEFGYFQVSKGTHTLKGDKPFGLMVYGYGNVTAYGYPGGMNLGQ